MIQIAFINRSRTVGDEEARAVAHSVHSQIRRDYAKAWGTSAHVEFVPRAGTPDPASWWLVVLDTSDEAGALGYHDLTPAQQPLGKVFAATTRRYGGLWSVTASHEALEMLGDPDINLLAPDDRGRIYAYENCDAVEADALGYDIDGQRVSDFVYPAWFSPSARGTGARFDHRGHIGAPFELAPGGYISYTETWPAAWRQQFAEDPQRASARFVAEARPRVGSRRERRYTDRSLWRLSTAE